jgi:hypothetical protein
MHRACTNSQPYQPTFQELAKRLSFYHSAQGAMRRPSICRAARGLTAFDSRAAIGSLISGVMQAAIIESIGGSHGIPAWRWLL